MPLESRGPEWDAAVQAAARRYVATTARRYVPVLVVAALVLTVIAFVPSVRPTAANGGNGAQATSTNGVTGTTSGTGAVGNTAAPGAAAVTGNGASGSVAGAGTTGSSGSNISSLGGAAPAQRGVAVGASGMTRSGVKCGPNVRQLPF